MVRKETSLKSIKEVIKTDAMMTLHLEAESGLNEAYGLVCLLFHGEEVRQRGCALHTQAIQDLYVQIYGPSHHANLALLIKLKCIAYSWLCYLKTKCRLGGKRPIFFIH